MGQQSSSNLPPLPEDIVEEQFAEESEEEDQTETIKIIMKQMQNLLLAQDKEKGNRRQSTTFTPGASPREPTLPTHVRPEDSPSSLTPGPRANSTSPKEKNSQTHKRREFSSIPTYPIPLQQQILRQERLVVKIEAKDYNLNFYGEVKTFISKVERISHIEGAREEDLTM
ncbi:hypothetical protein O181_036243 [Austropuccinia psidii MF-1]|uniref:Uncharacterized protein n=1 Tax=Austropuccinia psidii MF-1 TaxID=1389203 RepID=A0A9Q3D939_9BASI|nr:hypothetical protein [Austropuccinia psidii MF-1]